MPALEKGDFAAARPPLERACDAREPNGCYLLGRTLLALDQYEKAVRVLEPLVSTDPSPGRVADALGLCYEALRRTADAEAMYKKAGAAAQHRYGRFLIREGRAADAVKALAAVETPSGRFELGRALYQLGRLAEAENALEAAGSLPEAQALLAKVRRRRAPGSP
ncbi:MAG: tetratricopeptide repeat protein [Bryobacteraceae bacterium]|nr:tetratricopeptide repeat protein [Bryobacteraceae bacterium]